MKPKKLIVPAGSLVCVVFASSLLAETVSSSQQTTELFIEKEDQVLLPKPNPKPEPWDFAILPNTYALRPEKDPWAENGFWQRQEKTGFGRPPRNLRSTYQKRFAQNDFRRRR